MVNVRDPAVNPPNLAAVQEVSAGIYRVAQNVSVAESELWVDDIRLSQPVSQTGLAGSIDARLTASDVGSFAVAYVKQNGQFRQINQDPTYRGTDVLQLASNVRLDRFLPASFGLAMPFTVTYARTGIESGALDGNRSEGRITSRTSQARIVECDVLVVDSPGGPGQELGDARPRRPAPHHRNEYPGAKHDRPLECRGELVRAQRDVPAPNAAPWFPPASRRPGQGTPPMDARRRCRKGTPESGLQPRALPHPTQQWAQSRRIEFHGVPRARSLEATTPSFSRHWR